MPRIIRLIYGFWGWLCSEPHQHPRDSALLHGQVSQFQLWQILFHQHCQK